MATRSTIALQFADNTVQQVYCHWDGYLDNNGKILQEHYTDAFKLRELIDLGDMSSLGASIGNKHSFDIPFKYGTPEYIAESEARQDITTFYGRDRGESGTEARKYADIATYYKEAQQEEYDYILTPDRGWLVRCYATNGDWVTIAEAEALQAKMNGEEECE